MRYWGYFLAKLIAACAIVIAMGAVIRRFLPRQTVFWNTKQDPFAHDLTYTTVMFVFFLLCFGLFYLVIWDQRYRCRTCVRRLRMPVAAGSWPNMFLIGHPRTDYICAYGHGTLKVPELEFTGSEKSNWEQNQDMWKELESLESRNR